MENSRKMQQLSSYKAILKTTCEFYEVKEKDILSGSKRRLIVEARQTFLWACYLEGVDIYLLSGDLGKHRTTVVTTMRQGNHRRNKFAEKWVRKTYEKNSIL